MLGEKITWLVLHLMYVMLLIVIIAFAKEPIQALLYITSMTFSWLGTLMCIVLDELDELKKEMRNARDD